MRAVGGRCCAPCAQLQESRSDSGGQYPDQHHNGERRPRKLGRLKLVQEILSGQHRIAGFGVVFTDLQRRPRKVRAVRADVIRAEHQHRGVGMLGADDRRDVAKRSVVGRVVVEHHDLQVDAVVVGLVDQLEQARCDGGRRTDVSRRDLMLNHSKAVVGLGRRIDTDGAAYLARYVERRVRGGHGRQPYRLTTRALQQPVDCKKSTFPNPTECRTSVLLGLTARVGTARRRKTSGETADAADKPEPGAAAA